MTELIISLEIDGIHFWPNAPKQYKEFGQPHRHLFKVVAFYPVVDSKDPARRDKELFELRQETVTCLRNINGTYGKEPIDFGGRSCEGVADYLKKEMGFSKVFVGEDVNFGAIVS